MICPKCKMEYREGFEDCSDCGIPLVTDLPPERIDGPPPSRVTTGVPYYWVGYFLAIVFFAVFSVEVAVGRTLSPGITPGTLFFGLVGGTFWMFCIHRFHRILREATAGTHPISPADAVFYHFMPVYNLYWIFKWPKEFADSVNRYVPVDQRMPRFLGLLFLLGVLISGSLTGVSPCW